ncbi:hypothetical protein MKY96_33440 [Paenibacillus sp. FSL R7-0302]|uniref:hypothetical protein n=1 Tax=Paenibacillus sp. FSL R7-0302 TaxID=2921681 RepID=UPI0030FAFF6B
MTITEQIKNMVDEYITGVQKVDNHAFIFKTREKVVRFWCRLLETEFDSLQALDSERKRLSLPEITEGYKRVYLECLKDAGKLSNSKFSPALDTIEAETVNSIMFKVMIECDLMNEGEIPGMSRSERRNKNRQVKEFFQRWVSLVPYDERQVFLSEIQTLQRL